MCKERFSTDDDNALSKNYHKVRNHCHYIRLSLHNQRGTKRIQWSI